tara:strand:- start:3684 stop:7712 length:4029 start_codon:yes stop_codon:yes gene_type:complete
MAINESQKVDWLWKKLGYGVAKTDINGVKAATNESIASPLLIRGDNIWQDASQIPATKPSSSSTIVELYDDSGNGTATIEASADATATPNRTWKTNLTDWIPAEFGSTYLVKVYMDNISAAAPETTGTQLFAAGSGNNDEWYFDYQSGVLNFIGDNLPSGISGKIIYVAGARFVGNKGTNLASANIGNFTFNNNTMGVSNANGDIILDPDGTGKLSVLADNVTITGDGAIAIPVGTTAERPTPNAQGMIRYNTTDSTFEGYDGANWGSLGGVKDVDQDTYILAESSAGADNDELDFYTGGTQRAQIGATGDIKFGNTLAEFTIDGSNGDVTMAGDLQVAGNLQVDGTVTSVNSTTVTIDDPIFTLGGDTIPTTDDNLDRGIEFNWYDGGASLAKVGFFGFDDSTGKFMFIPDAVNNNEVFSGTAGDVVFGAANLSGLDVTGDTILRGDVTIGNADTDNISINGELRSNIVPDVTDAYDLGVTGKAWRDLYLSENIVYEGASGENGISLPSNMTGAFKIDDGTTTIVNIDTTTGAFAFDVTANTDITGTLDVSGESTLTSATISDITPTHIMYAGTAGSVDGDANLIWNGTKLDIGVGNFTVQHATGNTQIVGTLDVGSQSTLASVNVEDLTNNRIVIVGNSGELEDDANFRFDGTNFFIGPSGSEVFDVEVANGNTQITGTINVDSESTLASAIIEDLTDNRIVLAGTGGAVEDDANLTFDGTELNIGVGNFTVQHATGNTYAAGDLQVAGDLRVDGTTTTVNSTTVTIDDPIFTLGGDQTPASDDNKDRGIEFKWHDGTGAKLGFFGYDDSASKFTFIADATNTGEVFSGTAGDVAFGEGEFTGATIGDILIGSPTAFAIGIESTGDLSLVSQNNRILMAPQVGSGASEVVIDMVGPINVVGLSSLDGGIDVDGAFTVANTSGNITTTGTLDTGDATLDTATVSDLTDNEIVIAGTSGRLEGDSNFRFDGANFMIGASGSETFKVGVLSGNTEITGNLTLGGNITIGDADTDSIQLDGELTSNIVPDVNDTYDLGTATKSWRDLFISESVQFTGASTENELRIPGNMAVSLNVTDGANDLLVVNSTTGVNRIEVLALQVGTAAGTTTVDRILDEDDMVSDSDVALATQQSIKAYVDNSVGNVDLNFTDGTANGTVNLTTQNFSLLGTANEIETTALNQSLTIGLPNDVTIGNDLTITTNGSTGGTFAIGTSGTTATTFQVGTDLTVNNDAIVTNDLGVGVDLTVGQDLIVTRDATITGDLTVSGTTTYINTTTLNIGDNIITLNADITNLTAPTEDAGIEIKRGSASTVAFVWDETDDKWTAGAETIEAGLFEGSIDGGTF